MVRPLRGELVFWEVSYRVRLVIRLPRLMSVGDRLGYSP